MGCGALRTYAQQKAVFVDLVQSVASQRAARELNLTCDKSTRHEPKWLGERGFLLSDPVSEAVYCANWNYRQQDNKAVLPDSEGCVSRVARYPV